MTALNALRRQLTQQPEPAPAPPWRIPPGLGPDIVERASESTLIHYRELCDTADLCSHLDLQQVTIRGEPDSLRALWMATAAMESHVFVSVTPSNGSPVGIDVMFTRNALAHDRRIQWMLHPKKTRI